MISFNIGDELNAFQDGTPPCHRQMPKLATNIPCNSDSFIGKTEISVSEISQKDTRTNKHVENYTNEEKNRCPHIFESQSPGMTRENPRGVAFRKEKKWQNRSRSHKLKMKWSMK